jgi:Fe-S cluster assembly protein SufD
MTTALTHSHWESWLKDSLPSIRDERWKYADLSFLKQKDWVVAEDYPDVLSDAMLNTFRLKDTSAILLVLVNGHFNPSLSDLARLPKGAATGFSAQTQAVLSEATSPFAALNHAVAEQGLFLSIPAGCVLADPIHIVHLVVGDAPYVLHPCIQLLLGEQSQCAILEEYVSFNQSAYLVNAATQICLKQGAILHHTTLQRESEAATHIAQMNIYPAKDSQVYLTQFAMGARFSRDDVHVDLHEPHATCKTSGFYYLKHTNQYVDYHLDILHQAKSCHSEMRYKGIIGTRAKAVFNGKLKVTASASQTVAYQANHHVLLSPEAEAYSKPELEIDAESVMCKHGATTGCLSEAALFYLRSRGLSEEQAQQMLLAAFAEEILQAVYHPAIRERVRQVSP